MKTTLHTLLCIAIRLGAVLMAVNLLEQLPSFFVLNNETGHLAWLSLGLTGVGLVIAFALWVWPGLIVWWAVGRNGHELFESPIAASQLQHIVLSAMGAWLFINGLSACIGHGAITLAYIRESGAMTPTGEIRWIIQDAVTALAGIALMLGSRGLVELLYRLRSYPQPRQSEIEADTNIVKDG
jgi:hypothetical protein